MSKVVRKVRKPRTEALQQHPMEKYISKGVLPHRLAFSLRLFLLLAVHVYRLLLSEATTKTLNLSHATVREIFEMNTQVLLRNRPARDIQSNDVAAADLSKGLDLTPLREAILRLPRREQQELAALAWLGSKIFEDFDVAFSYAQILKEGELVEFLEIIPALDDLDRGMRLLEDNAIHLS